MFSFGKNKKGKEGSGASSGASSSTVASQSPDPRFAVYRDEDLTYTAPDTQLPQNAPVPFGVAPSGTLKIRLTTDVCPGFMPPPTCILLEYEIMAGTQKPYHPNPGVSYPSTTRHAYLPNDDNGTKLLARMKVAWNYGHMFKIGRSLTSGLDNQVCWTTIMNKTSLRGGTFGFPDATYLGKANAELDKIGIPSAEQCQHLLIPVQAAAAPLPPAMNPSFVPPSNTTAAANHNPFGAPATPSFGGPPMVPDVPVVSGVPAYGVASAPPPASQFPQGSVPVPSAAPPAPTNVWASSQQQQYDTDTVSYEQLYYAAPISLASTISSDLFETVTGDDECAICLEKVCKEKSVKIKTCQHEFHLSCLQDSMQHNPRCPTCRLPLDAARGKSPSGTMTIEPSYQDCPGFGDGVKTIQIKYDIPSGVQKDYHENPNQRFSGTTRVAYVPDNSEGRKLLKRLKYAWTHGLTFRVGTSLTTHQPNQVTWTSIHHKTSLHGGTHGFPDASYMDNVNNSLDALHVPREP